MQESNKIIYERHIAARSESGLSVEEYCRVNNIKSSIYHYYQKMHKQSISSKGEPGFISFGIAPVNCDVKIVTPSGLQIELSSLPNAEYLIALIKGYARP